MKSPRATEAQCQTTIIEAARLAGWYVHAERPARTTKGYRTAIQGHAGFPDIVAVRGDRFLIVELKRKPYKPSRAQTEWLIRMQDAGIDARLVWVPEQMRALIDELTAPA